MDGLMTNSIETLETSIFWQKYVLKMTYDPVQKERVKRAIEKLEAQLAEALQKA